LVESYLMQERTVALDETWVFLYDLDAK
jgi:hypothetical protein